MERSSGLRLREGEIGGSVGEGGGAGLHSWKSHPFEGGRRRKKTS